jgi:hypothetical protein
MVCTDSSLKKKQKGMYNAFTLFAIYYMLLCMGVQTKAATISRACSTDEEKRNA